MQTAGLRLEKIKQSNKSESLKKYLDSIEFWRILLQLARPGEI
jgi:hypothetical protein